MTILNDDTFVLYGGQTGTTTAAQRDIAYQIAENNAELQIGTFLSPTTVTGTYTWPPMNRSSFALKESHLKGVVSVTTVHEAGCDCLVDAVELSGCAWIMNLEGSIIQVRECGTVLRNNVCNCWGYGKPFQVRVVYTAGLATGTHTDPSLLQALTIGSQIALDQVTMQFPGEAGIKSFRSLSYSETRTDGSVKHTSFGNSPRANYAADLLDKFKVKRVGKMGF